MTDNPTDSAVTDAMTLMRRLQLVYDWLEERGQRYHCQTLDIVMSQASPPPADSVVTDAKKLIEESLYHLRLDERAKDYHHRALAYLAMSQASPVGWEGSRNDR